VIRLLVVCLLAPFVLFQAFAQTEVNDFYNEDSLTQVTVCAQIEHTLDQRMKLISHIVEKHLSSNFPDSLRQAATSNSTGQGGLLSKFTCELDQNCSTL